MVTHVFPSTVSNQISLSCSCPNSPILKANRKPTKIPAHVSNWDTVAVVPFSIRLRLHHRISSGLIGCFWCTRFFLPIASINARTRYAFPSKSHRPSTICKCLIALNLDATVLLPFPITLYSQVRNDSSSASQPCSFIFIHGEMPRPVQ